MSSLKVVTINIEGNKHISEVIEFIKAEDPDVVCLQEVLDRDVQTLKQSLSMEGEYVPCLSINEENFVGFPVGSTWGVLILTKHTDYSTTVKPYYKESDDLPKFGYKDPNAANRVLLTMEVMKDAVPFRIITTHFTWTPDGKSSELQKEHMEKLLRLLNSYPHFVLCGDFNAPRGGDIWEMLASRYNDNIPESVTSTVDPIIHRVKDLQLVVDGIFSTYDNVVSEVKTKDGVSDHKAVVATISK